MSIRPAQEIRVESVFNAPVSRVFKALSEGRLLLNCGGNSQTSLWDFKVGGKYRFEFAGHDVVHFGKFEEIVTDRKIVFSWSAEGADQGAPSRVSIELFPQGSGVAQKTRLVLVHTGDFTADMAGSYEGGWTGGLKDFTVEMEKGQLRMVRVFSVGVEALYAACSDPARFFGIISEVSKGEVDFRVGGKYRLPTKASEIRGEFLEIEPLKKISFSWLSAPCGVELKTDTRVTLLFDREDDGGSSLELIHERLVTDESLQSHRKGWDFVMGKLLATVR